MRKINLIVIHCSYTVPAADIGAAEIRDWHINDNRWSDIGYHYVIRRNGALEDGRPLERPGAHVAGHNADSIGICLVGGQAAEGGDDCNYTSAQWKTLDSLVAYLRGRFPDARLRGHRDFTRAKTCPVFDVQAWWSNRL